jgi:tetratricopeptide (TPR) repeat protein
VTQAISQRWNPKSEGIPKSEVCVNYPVTLESKDDLARLYKEKGYFDNAELLVLEALEGHRLKLGDTHPHTLESWNNLIDLYDAWNKPEKAEEWREKLAQMDGFEK